MRATGLSAVCLRLRQVQYVINMSRQHNTQYDQALFWFRRDLRTDDNAGLYHALKASREVYCVFVFDREILDALPSRTDRRVEFIVECVRSLRKDLRKLGGDLITLNGITHEEI